MTPQPKRFALLLKSIGIALGLLLSQTAIPAGAAAQQTVAAGTKPLAGHWVLVPSHDSAISHTPAAGRQTVASGFSKSVGQAPSTPLHVSATSHAPTAGRHTTPAATTACRHP